MASAFTHNELDWQAVVEEMAALQSILEDGFRWVAARPLLPACMQGHGHRRLRCGLPTAAAASAALPTTRPPHRRLTSCPGLADGTEGVEAEGLLSLPCPQLPAAAVSCEVLAPVDVPSGGLQLLLDVGAGSPAAHSQAGAAGQQDGTGRGSSSPTSMPIGDRVSQSCLACLGGNRPCAVAAAPRSAA
jgi:hypothetical protein